MSSPQRARFWWWRWAVAFVILVGIVLQVASRSQTSWHLPRPAHPGWLLVAFTMAITAYFAMVIAWTRLRRGSESWLALGGPWFASLLARYAPGGIWQGAVRVSAHVLEGERPGVEAGRYLSEQALGCFSAATLLLLTVAIAPLPTGIILALAVVGAGACVGATVLSRAFRVPFWPWSSLAWMLCAHALLSGGVVALLASWTPLDWITHLVVAQAFLLGGLAGVLVPLVPAGLGVREGVFIWILAPTLGMDVALALAIGSRVGLLVCELAAAALWGLAFRVLHAHPAQREARSAIDRYGFLQDPESRRQRGRRIANALEQLGGLDLRRGRVLDIGCSAGVVTAEIGKRAAFTVGIDQDQHSILQANEISTGSFYVVARGERLPFDTGSFDAVVCNHVYEHALDAHALMTEVHRVLKPGGVCYLAAGHTMQLVEPHHRLPLLSLLPRRVASTWLRCARGVHSYDERFLAPWRLHTLWRDFSSAEFISPAMLRDPERFEVALIARQSMALRWLVASLAQPIARLAPTWIFLLRR